MHHFEAHRFLSSFILHCRFLPSSPFHEVCILWVLTNMLCLVFDRFFRGAYKDMICENTREYESRYVVLSVLDRKSEEVQ
jgi:hypothetical protein